MSTLHNLMRDAAGPLDRKLATTPLPMIDNRYPHFEIDESTIAKSLTEPNLEFWADDRQR